MGDVAEVCPQPSVAVSGASLLPAPKSVAALAGLLTRSSSHASSAEGCAKGLANVESGSVIEGAPSDADMCARGVLSDAMTASVAAFSCACTSSSVPSGMMLLSLISSGPGRFSLPFFGDDEAGISELEPEEGSCGLSEFRFSKRCRSDHTLAEVAGLAVGEVLAEAVPTTGVSGVSVICFEAISGLELTASEGVAVDDDDLAALGVEANPSCVS